MVETTIEDPDVYRDDAPVDDRGRVTLGRKYADEKVRVVAEVIDDDE